jgi:hypothetical protein
MYLSIDPRHFEWVRNIQQEIIMRMANVSQGDTRGLPPSLRTARDAIYFPEVQQMLRRLAEYRLGIFMPHIHDETTGQFQPLPDQLIQVESGLEVSFHASEELTSQTDRFLPVGWFWRDGAGTPIAACEMVHEETAGDKGRYVKHKMPG